ncbi:MAG: undecaprenyl-diphosphate phosphatase [Verrucomicrobiales bacterium]|nr:undecaprenyl-diphosphate phosphatase [Verrucomicrobiales bacterium]
MPDWLAVVILGIIEGVTEFLPISSTGHLLLAEHWLPIRSEFIKSDLFTVVIQPGAVAAVVLLFWKRLLTLVLGFREPAHRDYLLKLGTAFFITGVGGLAIKKFGFELPDHVTPIALATLVGGVLFVAVEAWLKSKPTTVDVTWTIAIAMGVGQLLAAVFPGLSRSGSTILIALALGLARPQAAEFSFLLGVPTLLAAAAKETLDAIKDPPPFPIDWGMIALGALVSAITAFIAVRWLLKFVQTHTFTGFGIYRILLGGLLLLLA